MQTHKHFTVFESGNHIINYTFNPQFATIGSVLNKVSSDMILSEPMLTHNCNINLVKERGGKLTNNIINEIFKIDGEEIEAFCNKNNAVPMITTRSVKVSKDRYPIVNTGWHCDNVPSFAYKQSHQPDILNINTQCFNYACTISDTDNGTSNTEFIISPFICNIDVSCGVWNSITDNIKLQEKTIKTTFSADGHIIKFGAATLHRSTPAHTSGSRFWFRMELISKDNIKGNGNGKICSYYDMRDSLSMKFSRNIKET